MTSPQVLDSFEYSYRSLKAVVWTVWILPSISSYSSLFPSLWGLFQVFQLQLVTPFRSYFSSFSIIWQAPSICRSFRFLAFLHSGPLEGQNRLDDKFFFLVNRHYSWSSRQNKVICWYFKIPENFMRLILLKRFLFTYVPFDWSNVNFLYYYY